MSNNRNNNHVVNATPAKAFFVNMLTRDIELGDAILDLLDNCVDGILREIGNSPSDTNQPYKDYWAEITFGDDYFRIKDNCGGIPKRIGIEYAFRLGRTDFERDKDLPTVGMYGIGMKRAIFKIGKSCTVTSRNNNEAYKVTISPEWLTDDNSWSLPIEDIPIDDLEPGTIIEIRDIEPSIQHEFVKSKSAFIHNFKIAVATHYSFILHKGFKVAVREGDLIEEIKPASLQLKFEHPKEGKEEVIAPYLYKGTCQGVEVKLAVGFYRGFPTTDEMNDELAGKSASLEDAGWTIICNDRVVVYNDKTRVTGWGESGVPKYHTQFVSIAGIVYFQCNDARKLPVTTTKRGIDGNSLTYLTIKNIMRDGLRYFTSFTNKWKSPSEDRDELFKDAVSVDGLKVVDLLEEKYWKQVSEKKDYDGYVYTPTLPTIRVNSSMRQIQFSRPIKDINLVSEFLLDNSDEKPSKVGEECFDYCLRKAKKSI